MTKAHKNIAASSDGGPKPVAPQPRFL